jgi:hypothetical protein
LDGLFLLLALMAGFDGILPIWQTNIKPLMLPVAVTP